MPLGDVLLTLIVVGSLPLCVWRPWIGVLVFAWLGYMNPHRLMHGFAYSLPFAKLVAIATLLGLPLTKDRAAMPRTREVYLLLALWVTFLSSTLLTAIHPERARYELIQVSKILLMTAVTLVLFQDHRKLRLLLLVIALSIGYYGLTGGIWAVLTGGQQMLFGPPQSTIADNNGLAFALTIVLPLLIYLRYEERSPWLRHFLLVAFAGSIVAIVATYSRGSFLCLIVVLALLFLKTRLQDKGLVGAVLAAGLIVSLAPAQWYQRMATIPTAYHPGTSGGQRLKSGYVAYRLGLDHPVLGAGFRPFGPEVYERYLRGYADYHDAHNHFLQVLAEHGFTGLVLFSGLVLSVLLSLRRTIRVTRDDPGRQWMYHYAHGIEVSVLAYVGGGVFINLPYFDLFYQLVAITIILQQSAEAR